MAAFQVLLDLLLSMVILGGALPLSFSLLLIDSRSLQSDRQSSISLARALLVLLTSWSVIQVGLGLLLGMLGQLRLTSVVLAELLVLSVGVVLMVAQTKHKPGLNLAFKPFNRITRFMLYSIAVVGLFLLITIVTVPFIDYDSLWFHLPAIVRWYQTGFLTLLDPAGQWIFEHPDAARYPYNWHILSLLCLLPLGTDQLAALPNLLAWILLGLSVHCLSREFGASSFYSMAATALMLSMPFLMDRVHTAQADVSLAALFTVSLYFAYSCYKTRSTAAFFLFLASAGLLSGIKIPGVIYAALVGGFWTGLKLVRVDRLQSINQAPRKKTGLIVLGWVALMFLGGYWYVHNAKSAAIALSNLSSIVVADAEMSSLPKLSGLELLLQKLHDYQKSTLTAQFNPASLSHWKALTVQLVSRFQLPFVALTSQIILLPYVWIRYPKRCWQHPFVIAFVLFLISGFLYWNTPYSSGTAGLVSDQLSPLMGNNMRYGFPAIAMGTVMAAVVATLMQPPRWIVVAIVWLSSILSLFSTSFLYAMKARVFMGRGDVWLSKLIEQAPKQPGQLLEFGSSILPSLLQGNGLIALLLAVVYAVSSLAILKHKNLKIQLATFRVDSLKHSRFSRARLFRLSIVVVVFVGLLTSVGGHARQVSQTKLYQGLYEYLEQTVGAGNKIAYFSSPRNYLLYGRQFQQVVLHQFPNLNDPNRWLETLRQEQVGFVAVGPQDVDDQSTQGQFLQRLIEKGVLKADFGQDPARELVVFRLQPAKLDR